MRHGNQKFLGGGNHEQRVSILPMRHGNSSFPVSCSLFTSCFDPTYEAWKLFFWYFYSTSFQVSILPMRHGNGKLVLTPNLIILSFDPTYEAWKPGLDDKGVPRGTKFRSYLWGMETMRLVLHYQPRTCVSILPMRHGNLPQVTSTGWPLSCFDPTYEAWKRSSWKTVWLFFWTFRSYLWGMETQHLVWGSLFSERFRSYLWGMETVSRWRESNPDRGFDPTYEAWKPPGRWAGDKSPIVSILPMRHGNCCWM